ncbi:phosphonate metabolism protein/1,5-bisphosphokinase (PRPP-forming) PhnN [Mangrovicoccus algicola]|uniref:Ribose 1,5-bisphosphate phosphokinase PhnN n=1 Tax=Mangrovicoccus algicola TaxID=2771008 RepID=A0A8J6YXJ4_9RHOB|nr:phosphonate metabolism protein/1,5-bisphosphokinase (PRPP-forming) PhnN [Mangrovicoccus algicola]MBE3639632.1 phosphonate metabolism protein/1,5-bisphosphokinase (PRPP-forming) PhnN [Mangrovicoccus algicola]
MAFKGTLFLVVGPSGVGKDTLLDGAKEALGSYGFYRFCRRWITRDAEAGGEDYRPVSDAEFSRMLEAGAFFHHWEAHGLRYGLPGDIRDDLERGIHVILNGSRRELAGMAALWEDTVVISIEASPEVIAARLTARGRESAEEIEKRIARRAEVPQVGRTVIRVRNEAGREEGIRALVQAIVGSAGQHFRGEASSLRTVNGNLCVISDAHPVAEILRAQGSRVELVNAAGTEVVAELAYDTGDRVSADACLLDIKLAARLGIGEGAVLELRPAPSPLSREVLRRKVRGEELSAADIEQVVDEMVRGRYSQTELAGFLVSAANGLTTAEVVALARSRAARTENLRWDAPVVVDKHSMGGIPGNRITPIIIPIVAAAGLIMPKTSSRAITSASGTADAMEVMARVDLSPDELRRVVRETGGCIAWNGNLTHSPVDDVMNAINQPLGLKSAQLDVSSILSKKLAAGSTHVLIDMPVGPEAKTRTAAEAAELETLFRTVAQALGIQARVMVTDGTGPVGRGIGPALEMRDAMMVLENDPGAPADLREKALLYAATILDWAAPAPRSGRDRAEELLSSGAAAAKFRAILAAQGMRGARAPAPAPLTETIATPAAMEMPGFGVRSVAAIARATGAPLVPAAGVDLLALPGAHLEPGAPLLRIHAATSFALQAAASRARDALASGQLFRTVPRIAEPV